jgi:hypothetical protein
MFPSAILPALRLRSGQTAAWCLNDFITEEKYRCANGCEASRKLHP